MNYKRLTSHEAGSSDQEVFAYVPRTGYYKPRHDEVKYLVEAEDGDITTIPANAISNRMTVRLLRTSRDPYDVGRGDSGPLMQHIEIDGCTITVQADNLAKIADGDNTLNMYGLRAAAVRIEIEKEK